MKFDVNKLAKRLFVAGIILLAISFILRFAAKYYGQSAAAPVSQNATSSSPALIYGWQTYEDASLGISFEYPKSFEQQDGNPNVFLAKDKSGDEIGERKIESADNALKSVEAALLDDVVYGASGAHPKSIGEFQKVTIAGRQFYKIRTERFEGVLSYNYYLPLGNQIAVFSFRAQGVDWTNPNLDEETVPAHFVLKQVLATLKFTK